MYENVLKNEIIRLKDRLISESKKKEKPIIVEDNDIDKIINVKSYQELASLNLVEERYLKDFFTLINEFNKVKANLEEPSALTVKTLKELEKKLIDINKRNRMLYFPKVPLTAYDLTLNADPLDLLFRHKSLKITSDMTFEYKVFNNIYRDASKNYRDKGIMDLYVGYPFIKGKLDEDFYLYAPLALFPIAIEKGVDYLKIKLDSSKEITYNSHLLLAHYKFNEINKPLPDVTLDEVELKNFIPNLKAFYEEEGIRFFSDNSSPVNFVEASPLTLKYYKKGDYSLEGFAIFGRFSSYSTVIQKDFELFLNNNVTTPNLSVLLDNKELKEHKIELSEKDLSYVGNLNSSQEEVIKAIKRKDIVVVEGPPGTGKSQTITSLVTNFVLDNKNVLLVSEKKAALDVVYSRLQSLNKFAFQIDDINDKKAFYDKLKDILSLDVNSYNDIPMSLVNDELEATFKRLENIDKAFYQVNDLYKVPFYKFYLDSYNYDFNKPELKKNYLSLEENLSDFDFSYYDYPSLKNTFNKFNDNSILTKAFLYKKYEHSFMAYLTEGFSELVLVDLRSDLKKLIKVVDEYNNKNGFNRLFKGKVKKEAYNFIDKYFKVKKHRYYKVLLTDKLDVSYLDDYYNFNSSKAIFNSLDKLDKLYLDALIKVVKYYNNNYSLANKELLNYIFYKIIKDYENNNLELINDCKNYQALVNKLDSLLNEKKELVKKEVTNILSKNIKEYIFASANFNDLNHNALSEKKRFSVERFFNKYYYELYNGIKIWLMTPEVVSSLFPLFESLFDLVIFDEASQLYVEKSIPSLFRGKKIVIAGDSKQLRPSSLGSGRLEYDFDEYDEDNIALEEESLLNLAKYKVMPPVVLNFHYRSRYQELISFSNYAFYDDNLYISPNVSISSFKPIEVFKVDGKWINRQNVVEAKKVIELLKQIFKTRLHNETIGIITFNSQQRDLIYDMIDEECMHDGEFQKNVEVEFARKLDGEDIGLFVKNIENVQGDERDIIIFSIGYAKNEDGKFIHNFGWLNQKGGENRLNVAITRAKEHIFIVTSIRPTDLKIDKTINMGPFMLKKYLEYCFSVSEADFKKAKNTLYSLHEEFLVESYKSSFMLDVYKEISKHGFNIKYNVGIGKYSIDVAILQNDKFILGLDFDTSLVRLETNYRERDYFRIKYLEARSWHIYRIFVMLWWKNKDEVIKDIMNYIYLICKDNQYEIEE